MKVNFNVKFKGLHGEELDRLISDALAEAMYSAGSEGNQIPNEEKFVAYKICTRIISSKNEIEITTEEASLIKRVAANCFTAGAYGQIYELIENESVSHGSNKKGK